MVVVVVTPEISSEVVTIPTESEVETPLRVDAGSTTTGVSVVGPLCYQLEYQLQQQL